jgi:RNA polymerase sigma factor (sigma-70 family)
MTKSPVPASRRRIERALSRLRPIEREVLSLSAGEGLGLAEIALRLGIPVEAAQRHLADALYRLDRVLERRPRSCWLWRRPW